ncbi:hypothetical protein CsatB_030452 [Cannabis sativa]
MQISAIKLSLSSKADRLEKSLETYILLIFPNVSFIYLLIALCQSNISSIGCEPVSLSQLALIVYLLMWSNSESSSFVQKKFFEYVLKHFINSVLLFLSLMIVIIGIFY